MRQCTQNNLNVATCENDFLPPSHWGPGSLHGAHKGVTKLLQPAPQVHPSLFLVSPCPPWSVTGIQSTSHVASVHHLCEYVCPNHCGSLKSNTHSVAGSEAIEWLAGGSHSSKKDGKAKLGFWESLAGLEHRRAGARGHGE